MNPRKRLINVLASDAIVLWQLPPTFYRSAVDTIIGTECMTSAQQYVQRLVARQYIKPTFNKDRNNGKQYQLTERGKEIAVCFGQLIMEAQ